MQNAPRAFEQPAKTGDMLVSLGRHRFLRHAMIAEPRKPDSGWSPSGCDGGAHQPTRQSVMVDQFNRLITLNLTECLESRLNFL